MSPTGASREWSCRPFARRTRFLGAILALGLLLLAAGARGAEVIPPAPPNHFNDYAGLVRADIAAVLESELTQFERDTSNQILVAIYPRMQSESSIEDYTVRVAQAWKVGRADRKNGAVLFIFSQDHKLYIVTGYGLEGALPDVRCQQIIENEITPRFRQGDFTGGVAAGTRAMLAAVRGEYHGSGRTITDGRGASNNVWVGLIFVVAIFLLTAWSARRRQRGVVLYQRGGRVVTYGNWGGGSSGGGFGGGGGGGSFSGGGGSFGGGGAGGSW